MFAAFKIAETHEYETDVMRSIKGKVSDAATPAPNFSRAIEAAEWARGEKQVENDTSTS